MSRFPYKQVILSVFLFTLVSCVPSFEDIDDSFNVLDAGLDVAFETLRFIVNEPETVEALVNLFNQNNQSSGDLTPVTINSTAISLTDSSNSGINLIDFKVLSPVTKNILFGETIEIELNYEMLNQNRYFARAGLLNDKNVPLAMLPYNGKQAI